MRRTFSLAVCLVALAPVSLAWSQQEPATQPVRPQTETEARPRTDAEPQTEARPRAGRQAQPGAQGQRPGRGAAANAERSVSQMATLLALGNRAEVELGELAAQKTTNEKVREFARMMVEQHTAVLQKLEPFNPQLGPANRNRARLEAAGERQRAGRDGQSAAADQPAGDQPAAADQPAAGRPSADGARSAQGGLMGIIQDGSRRSLEMTKQTLSKYEGQDFDMGYLGQQILAHVHMLAYLQAMQGKGTPEFQQLVEEGIQGVNQHLAAPKSLASQLEDKERGAASPRTSPGASPAQPATRPAQPGAQ